MANGTEGNDILTNDSSVSDDVVNALGGNDIIRIVDPVDEGTVSVDGGDGFDTLIINALSPAQDWALEQGLITAEGGFVDLVYDQPFGFATRISYTSIEKLVITGPANIFFDLTTGDTADRITIVGDQPAAVHTGGGNDKVYLKDNAGGGDCNLGSGDDVFDGSALLAGSLGVFVLGGDGKDLLIGSSDSDELDGETGADTMKGGDGGDYYHVDDAGDRIVELDGNGIDTVYSTITFSLAHQSLENLALIDEGAINASGNALQNDITGNIAANELRGFAGNDTLDGGAGADTLYGGGGNDTYIVDNVGDRVVEGSTGGTDAVNASATFTLGACVEDLALIGAAHIDGTGNSLANSITGNSVGNVLNGAAGDDTLSGGGGIDTLGGGTGKDTLTGGGGADKFLFDAPLDAATNVDRIVDFNVADDTIRIDHAIFTQLTGTGTIAASAFFAGTAAHDADDRIIYDSATGKIYYDADGMGGGAKILFAQITAGLALSNADFSVVATASAAPRDTAPASALHPFRDMTDDRPGLLLMAHHHVFSHPDDLLG
jgi:Ca2+-binding RTX toxin-like protein